MDYKEPGLYYNVPMYEYRKWPFLCKSMFQSILRSGKQFKHHIECEEKPTAIMEFGNLVDTLLLEPKEFSSRYSVIPETYIGTDKKESVEKPWNWNSNVCKEWRDKLPIGVTPISSKDIAMAQHIAGEVKTHPEAGKWLEGAITQVSMVWIDPETGIKCKGRLDALRPVERLIDLKVTDDPLPFAFSGILNRFKYHVQAAFYHDGYFLSQGKSIGCGPQIPFSFIACESEPPHDVVPYNLGIESFEVGRIVYREAIARYKEIIESGDYSGYTNVAEEINVPQWAINKVQMEGVVE